PGESCTGCRVGRNELRRGRPCRLTENESGSEGQRRSTPPTESKAFGPTRSVPVKRVFEGGPEPETVRWGAARRGVMRGERGMAPLPRARTAARDWPIPPCGGTRAFH